MVEKHNTESFAIVLDGRGGIKAKTSPNETEKTSSPLWLNLDYKDEANRKLLVDKFGMDNYIADSLFSFTVKQKYFKNDKPAGTFMILKGPGLKEVEKPRDMLTLRIWIEENKIVTCCHKFSPSVNEVIEKLNNGQGPKNVIEIFLVLSQSSFHGISDITYEMIEKIDSFEEKVIKSRDSIKFNNKIAELRRKVVTIHRYLLPQKEIYKNLPVDCPILSDTRYKNQFRDLYNDISKSIDNLDYSREHILILKEEMENSINISINNNMYILSIIVAIFTPLTLISGILGMNLEGIPYADSPYSFPIVCFSMIFAAAVMFWAIKRKKIV